MAGMWIIATLLFLTSLSLFGCSDRTSRATPDASPPADVSVRVAPAEHAQIHRALTLPASVEAFEEARLYAKVSGYLGEISVDIGDHVTEDQVLAVLDIPEMEGEYAAVEARLAEARANQAKAEADARLQELIHERSKGLRERAAITEQDLDEAKAKHAASQATLALARARVKTAKAELARHDALMQYIYIRAPFDGVVTERFADPGTLIQIATTDPDVTPIVTVARVDRVRVSIDIPEPEVPFVDKQDRATFRPNALGDVAFEGHVSRSAGALNPATRTMRTEVDFANLDGRLYPGMYGTLTIELETHDEAVTVPAAVVATDKDGNAYINVVRDGVVHKQPVRIGIDDGIRVEVLEGVSEKEQCIVSASGSVEDGAPVEVIESTDLGAGRS